MSIKVITFGGNEYTYTADEVQEMLNDKEAYKDADNLPKWIFVAGVLHGVPGFPKTFAGVWRLLVSVVLSGDVVINVRSDNRSANKITITAVETK